MRSEYYDIVNLLKENLEISKKLLTDFTTLKTDFDRIVRERDEFEASLSSAFTDLSANIKFNLPKDFQGEF